MHNFKFILLFLGLVSLSFSQNTTLRVTYENFDFSNSMKKDNGKRYGAIVSHRNDDSLYQLAYDKTDTETYKPPLTKDLKVDKYYLKYSRKLNAKHSLSLSYATINDNLMKETDGGHIYGLGYRYGAFGATQYFSDYNNFDVYQTEMKYTFNRAFGDLKTKLTLLGKYIHLQDKESNGFSKNAQEDYFTPGVKVHAHYNAYHMGAGAFFGKRIFAVMNDGFKVQHHAMEFNKTYMIGFGRHFGDIDLSMKYIYQEATEVPSHNPNVEMQNIMLQLGYRF